MRLANWLTLEQSRSLLRTPNAEGVKGRLDRAIVALLLGCGLRRGEVANLRLDHLHNRRDTKNVIAERPLERL